MGNQGRPHVDDRAGLARGLLCLGLSLGIAACGATASGPQATGTVPTQPSLTARPTSGPMATPSTSGPATSTSRPAAFSWGTTSQKSGTFDVQLPDQLLAAEVSHSGSGAFVLRTLDARGGEIAVPVTTVGDYRGTVLLGPHTGDIKALKVEEAGGVWSITLSDLGSYSIEVWHPERGPLEDSGDDVVLVRPPTSGGFDVRVAREGDGDFALRAWADSPELSLKVSGPYTGDITLPAGTSLLDVRASGGWTLSQP